MKVEVKNPPRTYQDWLECFDEIRGNRISEDYIELLASGTLQSGFHMMDMFETHVVALLNDMVDSRSKRFTKELNYLLASGDMFDLVELFRRFKREIGQCMFFYKVECIPIEFRSELMEALTEQTNKFLGATIKFLMDMALETNNVDLEDALYQIRRIKFFCV